MEVRDYIRLLRRSWSLILILVLGSVGIAAGITLLIPPQYQSTAKVFISIESSSNATDLNNASSFTQQMVQSYADLTQTPIVLNPVIQRLKLNTTAAKLAQHVSATAPLDTVLVEVAATDSSPNRAAQIAEAVSESLRATVPKVTPTRGSTSSPVVVTSIQPATIPTAPFSPVLSLALLIGGAVGIVLAVLIAFLRDQLDIRLRGPRDVELLTGGRVLGSIPVDASARDHPLIVAGSDQSRRAEAFRALRTTLQFLNFSGTSRAFVVTSSINREGKTTTAANLAIAMTDAGSRVLLVDADMRQPRVIEYLGMEAKEGLSEVLSGRADAQSAIQTWNEVGLSVLPAGRTPPNPSELLQSDALVDLISLLSDTFDTIIFDSPPLLAATDAAILSRRTSGALMVCAEGRTDRHQLTDAVGILNQVDARILGFVMTMTPQRSSERYGVGSLAYRIREEPAV